MIKTEYKRYENMSDILFCSECNTLFDKNYIKLREDYGYYVCPNLECSGHNVSKIFEIDELMVYAIKTLNDKGYFTNYCCSGHSYNDTNYSSGYIQFSGESYIPDTLPELWSYDDNNCIRAYGNRFEYITNLNEWCKKLYPFKNKPFNF